MDENGFNPLQGIFDLLGKKLDADAQTKRTAWQAQTLYGVDEYGRPYYRGLASPSLMPGLQSSPLVIVGVGILAVALVVYAIKS